MNTPATTSSAVRSQLPTIYASFGVRGSELTPNEITDRLGIQPSHSFARGDEYATHLGKTKMGVRVRAFGVWQVSSEGAVNSVNVQDHVDYLVGVIEPKREEIEALLSDPELYLDIRLWVESHDAVNAFALRSDSIAILASLCREFNISVIGGEGG